MLTKHIFVHTIILDRERPYRRTSAMGVHYKENPNLIKCEGSTIKKSQLKIDSCTEVQESFLKERKKVLQTQGFFVTMKVAVYAAFYFCAQKPLF